MVATLLCAVALTGFMFISLGEANENTLLALSWEGILLLHTVGMKWNLSFQFSSQLQDCQARIHA